MNNGIWLNENKFVQFSELQDNNLTEQIFSRAQSSQFWSTMFTTLPDPDLVLQAAGNWVETFNKMMNDPHIFAEFEKRKALTTSLDFVINRGAASKKFYDLLEAYINSNDHELFSSVGKHQNDEEDADIYDLINEGLDAVPFGYQPVEVVWEKVGTYFLPVKLIDRPHQWFHFDMNNQPRFKSKASPVEGELIPDKKILMFRHQARYNNPYGVRVLSKCFWAWTFKHTTEKWKIQFLEKFATVFAIAKLPRGKENKEYQNTLEALFDMINNTVAVIPEDGSVELMEAAGKGSTSNIFDQNISLYNSEMSKAIITVESLTGKGDGGSRARDEVMERLAAALGVSDKKIVLKKTDLLFRWIGEINGFGAAPTSDLIKPVDHVKRAELDTKLKELGVGFKKSHFIENYNLKDQDFDIHSETKPEPITDPVQFAELEKTDDLKNLLNALPSNTLQTMIEPFINQIKKAFEESTNFEEAMEKAITLVPGVSTDQLEEFIGKLRFTSFIKGTADAQDLQQ